MTHNRYDHCVSVYNGKMYVFGGRLLAGNGRTTIVEVYEPSTDTWTESDRGMPPYSKCSAATFNDRIFVCGYKGKEASRCVEYDPATNTHTNFAAPRDQVSGARLLLQNL